MIDEIGHAFGWGSPQQLKQFTIVDQQIGQIMEQVHAAVQTRQESWLVMVTADHGGHNFTHGDGWFHDEVVPLIIAVYTPTGPLTNLRDLFFPRHFDIAPTVMNWLGLNHWSPLLSVDGLVQAIPTSTRV